MADSYIGELRKLIEAFRRMYDIATEIVEGLVPEDVTIEDGTVRPNFEKRLRQLLANVDIYSDPNTGNTAVEEGRFFGVVINSNEKYSLDIYQKINGQPVLRLSNAGYNDVNTSIPDIPGATHQPLVSLLKNTGKQLWETGTASTAGDLVETGSIAPKYSVYSDLIDVKKGDCYCLTIGRDGAYNTSINMVAFYQNSQAVGSLVWANRKCATDNVLLQAFDQEGNANRQLQKWFRVPEDGQIRICTTKTCAQTGYLSKAPLQAFIDNMVWRGAKLNAKAWESKGALYSPLLTNLGYMPQLGSDDNVASASKAMTDFIPVKSGQYLNSIHPNYDTSGILAIYDSSKALVSYLGRYNNITGSVLYGSVSNGNETVANAAIATVENYKFTSDGYIRLVLDTGYTGFNDGFMYRIDNAFVDYDYPWTNENNPPVRINGIVSTEQGRQFHVPTATDSSFPTDNPKTMDVLCDIYIKPGMVARFEYETVSVSKNHCMYFVQNPDLFARNLLYTSAAAIGFEPRAVATVGAKKVSYVYDPDHVISATMTTASGTGSVEVMTIEESIARRNEDLKTLKYCPGMEGVSAWNAPYGVSTSLGTATEYKYVGLGWIPLLPREVLFYKSNDQNMRVSGIISNEFKSIGDPTVVTLTNEDSYYLISHSGSVNTVNRAWDNAFTDVSRIIQNRDNFNYFSLLAYDNGAPDTPYDWDSFLSEGDVFIMSEEQFKAEYMNTGKSLPAGYINNNKLNTAWDEDGNAVFHSISTGLGWKTTYPFFAVKGMCYKLTWNTDRTANSACPLVIEVDPVDKGCGYELKPLIPFTPTPASDIVRPSPCVVYYKAEKDSILYFSGRYLAENDTATAAVQRCIDNMQQLGIELISEDVYHQNTDILFEDKVLYLPEEEGLEFKVVNGIAPYDPSGESFKVPCQVWQNGKHMTTFLMETAIQGQATSGNSYIKINWDVKGYNSKGKKIKFKIGDWQMTNKLVLKANITEGSQHRDTLANKLFQVARRAGNKSVIDDRIYEKDMTKYPDLRYVCDADGGMRGVPCSLHVGDQFYGLYTLRTKKDELNFGVVKDDKDFIWLQSDYLTYKQNHGGGNNLITWNKFSWKQWEVTQPEKLAGKNYEVGFEPEDAGVKAAVERLFNWIAGCVNGTEGYDFDADVENYINVESLIDYWMTGELIYAWDNAQNNVILTTYNATDDNAIWTFYFYDGDHTMDYGNDSITAKTNEIVAIPSKGQLYLLLRNSTKYWPTVCARWAARRADVWSDDNIRKMVEAEQRKVPTKWRDLDVDNWGYVNGASTTKLRGWLVNRARAMDNYFRE